jgi:hypothetical protein
MSMFRAGLAAAAVFIGAIGALLGVVMLVSALGSGTIAMSYGTGVNAVAETVSRAGDPGRFWRLVAALGVGPLVLGTAAAIWGSRQLRR